MAMRLFRIILRLIFVLSTRRPVDAINVLTFRTRIPTVKILGGLGAPPCSV